jgi:uncharacterized protein
MNIHSIPIIILCSAAMFLIIMDGMRRPEAQFISRVLVKIIELYQRFISRGILEKNNISICRFQPTCSEYTRQSLMKYGLFRGSLKGITRILRCNPFFPGGMDEP